MGAHLIDGEFQSDKYPTTPRGKVPLSVKDQTAQDLLWEYAQRRRVVDAEFSDDLETALRTAGYTPQPKLEWCEHCTFAKHLHGDGFLPPGCIGFVPNGAARCEKRDGQGRRCSLVADHGDHHEIHAPYDNDAKPMPRNGVSASR